MPARTLAIVAVVVLVALVSVSRSDHGLPPEKYFPQLEALMVDLRAGEAELGNQHRDPPTDAPLELMTTTLQETYAAYDELRTLFAVNLGDLKPPSGAKRSHRMLVSSAEEIAEGQLEAIRLLGEVKILVDVHAAFRHLYTPTQVFNKACSELQDEADELEIAVNLHCPY